MHPSIYRIDSSYTSLGERRGKLDLARFSLDLSWARGVSHSARSRAYPSPPMSGSPSIPPRHIPEFDDRGHGGFGTQASESSLVLPTTQPELRENVKKAASVGTYQQDIRAIAAYSQYPPPSGIPMEQPQYQYQHQALPQQQQQQQAAPLPTYQFSPPQPQGPYPGSGVERGPNTEAPDFNSPKPQRKTKGHVASACVPCKRAHLR
jgi:hypothetical protein